MMGDAEPAPGGGRTSHGLSTYVLTHNSERRLDQVLAAIRPVSDELVVVDSGSGDATLEIAARHGARVLIRPLDNFSRQRAFAIAQCQSDWVLAIDSDEVASGALIARLAALKRAGFATAEQADAFAIRRDWFFLQREVHCFYPSHCPDWPVRLFRRDRARLAEDREVHEAMRGFARVARLDAPLLHYTCDTIDDLYGKLNLYSSLAARDLRRAGVRPHWLKVAVLPWLIAGRWYFLAGGWRDGASGVILGRYVFDMIYQKHLKLLYDPA